MKKQIRSIVHIIFLLLISRLVFAQNNEINDFLVSVLDGGKISYYFKEKYHNQSLHVDVQKTIFCNKKKGVYFSPLERNKYFKLNAYIEKKQQYIYLGRGASFITCVKEDNNATIGILELKEIDQDEFILQN